MGRQTLGFEHTTNLVGRRAGWVERRWNRPFLERGMLGSSFLANRGSSRGRKRDQTVSESAAARKAREPPAVWQAS
jgi:hypothetical protein